MQRRDQNWCVFFFCISNNVIWLIMLPEIIKFRSNRIWIYFPYNCYEGQKVDTILNGGVVWTRPVYKSEINIDGWAKLTGMVASDGLWQPPPAWGWLASIQPPPYREWVMTTSSDWKPLQAKARNFHFNQITHREISPQYKSIHEIIIGVLGAKQALLIF